MGEMAGMATAGVTPDGFQSGADGPPLRVVVTDRGRAFAEALTELLSSGGMQAWAAGYDTVADVCERLRPTVLLIDGEGGRDEITGCVQAARSAREDVRVLLLVSRVTGTEERLAAELNAAGIVTRQCTPRQLFDAVTGRGGTLHRRAWPSTNGVFPAPGNPLERLTPRELEVLQALMGGGRSADIAAALGISPHTVRTHVQNTFGKLAVRTRWEAASLARAAGLRPTTLPLSPTGSAE